MILNIMKQIITISLFLLGKNVFWSHWPEKEKSVKNKKKNYRKFKLVAKLFFALNGKYEYSPIVWFIQRKMWYV